MTTKKAAAKLRSKNTYSVIRVEFVTATGTPARLWNVSVKRHGRLFNRNFYDATYGGQEPARLMGLAYRDCLMQLFPPLTQLEQRTKVRANNKSGVSGVMAKYDRGRLKAWQATIEVSGVVHQKYFSVREFGEEKAKELAIKARQAFLAQCPLNRFVTVNADATQHAESTFAELLNMDAANGSPLNAGLVPDTDTINRQLELLNAWFDALRPQCIHVRLSVYPIPSRAHTGLFVVVGDGNAPGGHCSAKTGACKAKATKRRWCWLGNMFKPSSPHKWGRIVGKSFRPVIRNRSLPARQPRRSLSATATTRREGHLCAPLRPWSCCPCCARSTFLCSLPKLDLRKVCKSPPPEPLGR